MTAKSSPSGPEEEQTVKSKAEKPQSAGRRKGTTLRTPEHSLLVEQLIAARRTAGLTQTQLAEKIGKDQSHISRIEAAERDVSVLDLVFWCQAVGVRFSDFTHRFEQLLLDLETVV